MPVAIITIDMIISRFNLLLLNKKDEKYPTLSSGAGFFSGFGQIIIPSVSESHYGSKRKSKPYHRTKIPMAHEVHRKHIQTTNRKHGKYDIEDCQRYTFGFAGQLLRG
jgi:hypothetical protein